MRKFLLGLALISFGLVIALLLNGLGLRPSSPPVKPVSLPEASASVAIASLTPVEYEVYPIAQSLVHVLRVPAQAGLMVVPVVASELMPLPDFVQQRGAIAGVNGGFFDPANQKTTSYIVLNGEVAEDPAQNERLTTNPDMIPILDQIFNRTEFRQYHCGQTIRYDIASHQEAAPDGCSLIAALGAGPRLLPDLTLEEEGFATIANGEVVRDALGSNQPNARTAIGITPAGDVILVMAAQLPEFPSDSGLSLPDLAAFMGTLGVEEAMNLDGGSSASLSYGNETYYGRVDGAGNRIERPVKSVLLVL